MKDLREEEELNVGHVTSTVHRHKDMVTEFKYSGRLWKEYLKSEVTGACMNGR